MDAGMGQLESKIAGLTARVEEISDVEDQIQTKNFAISEHRGNVRMSKTTLASYQTDLKNAENQVKEVDESLLISYGKELVEKQKTQEQAFAEAETLGVVANMLKDGGIKTRIIKQYVPVMNQLINKFLAAFDLFVDFQLDESFNETIKSRFRDDFTYMSFSEGEKTKIDISLMLTWRAVSKMRNSVTTNLLIMDEIFDGSIDATGIDNLIQILNKLNEHDNIFVISHKGDVIDGLFEEIIKFEKVKNFSRIAD
jgi:DNA repair exonuclease SbcCD ATPase subunit